MNLEMRQCIRRVAKPGRRAGTAAGWLARRGWLLALCWLGSISVQGASEYEIKAAYLFNFAKFIEWPALALTNTSAPVVIGVVGEDPFGDKLPDTIHGETIKGRPILIRHYQPTNDLAGCHVLFLSRSARDHFPDLLKQAATQHILAVSESEEFLEQGGMINFAFVGKSVRFDINVRAMEQAGLKASSKLLAIARSVQGKP